MTGGYVEWKRWQDADFGTFTSEHAAYYAQELRSSGIASVAGLNVAELGYGNGSFAGWVRQGQGVWVGREVIPELQQRAAQAGFRVIAANDDFSSASSDGFDLITAWDVVEHLDVDTARAFLAEARRALKPGGTLLFRVPSGDSPFSGAIYRGDLTHRLLLGSSAVRQLAQESGFEITQVRSPAFPVRGLGLVRTVRRTLVRAVQGCVFALVRHMLIGDPAAVVSPNMIVVLRKSADVAEPRTRGVAA